jgi:hypothetical protein
MGAKTLSYVVAIALATPAWAATTIVNRDDFVIASGFVQRLSSADNTIIEQDSFFQATDHGNSNVALTQSVSATDSGSINDTATDLQLVASGSGAASATSTLAFSGDTLTSYSLSGNYAGMLTTGTLNGYKPDANDPESHVEASAGGLYNSGISLITDAPLAYTMTVSQSERVGTVFNAGLIYLDVDGDGNEGPDDVTIQPYFVVGNSPDDQESKTVTGVLEPSLYPYRIFFFGNTGIGATTDNASFEASADFTSSFTVVPEPASMTLIAAVSLLLLRRRASVRPAMG